MSNEKGPRQLFENVHFLCTILYCEQLIPSYSRNRIELKTLLMCWSRLAWEKAHTNLGTKKIGAA